MKKLIVNADDFGLTKEISEEILNIFSLEILVVHP